MEGYSIGNDATCSTHAGSNQNVCLSSILIRIRTDRIFKRVGIDGRLGWGNMGERKD